MFDKPTYIKKAVIVNIAEKKQLFSFVILIGFSLL